MYTTTNGAGWIRCRTPQVPVPPPHKRCAVGTAPTRAPFANTTTHAHLTAEAVAPTAGTAHRCVRHTSNRTLLSSAGYRRRSAAGGSYRRFEAAGSTSLLFATTLPVVGLAIRQELSDEPAARTTRPAATKATSAASFTKSRDSGSPECGARQHSLLLLEERETHRKSLDRAWQRFQAAEAALAKQAATHQLHVFSLRADALHMAEALSRSELARDELGARLEAEREHYRLCERNPSSRRDLHSASLAMDSPTPRALNTRSPPSPSSSLTTPQAEVAAEPTAPSPTLMRARPRRKKSSQAPVRPRLSKAGDSHGAGSATPPLTSASSPVAATRPMTGLVRDSDLLRHLQQAEMRIRHLEMRLREQQAHPPQHLNLDDGDRGDVPYSAVTNTYIVLDDDAELESSVTDQP